MSKAPAFQWYAADYLADERVMLLSLESEAAYVRLLNYCWREGSIPANPALCAPMCKYADAKVIKAALALFIKSPEQPGRMIHKRLEEERAKQEAFRAKQSAKGAKGGRPPKAAGKPDESHSKPAALPQLNHSLTAVKPDESSLSSTSSSLPTKVGRNASEPSSQPADLEKEPTKFFPDAAHVFSSAGFRAFVEKMNFGHIDRGFYLTDIQRKAELTKQERDETGWENFVLDFLKREVAAQKLLLRELTDPTARTGVHAPQSPDAPNHKRRPEVQARYDAEFEASKQQRIAANLARNAADGLSSQPQPGGVARRI